MTIEMELIPGQQTGQEPYISPRGLLSSKPRGQRKSHCTRLTQLIILSGVSHPYMRVPQINGE